ncbi:hypothetical protein D3C77_566250 [compost metagenome]
MQAGEVNIHKLSNIIYLPKYGENHPVRTVHRGSHAQYTAAVEKKLDIIHEYGKKNGWTKADYQKAIHGVMVDARKGLRSGKTMLNKNSVRGGLWLAIIFCAFQMTIRKTTGLKLKFCRVRIRVYSKKVWLSVRV